MFFHPLRILLYSRCDLEDRVPPVAVVPLFTDYCHVSSQSSLHQIVSLLTIFGIPVVRIFLQCGRQTLHSFCFFFFFGQFLSKGSLELCYLSDEIMFINFSTVFIFLKTLTAFIQPVLTHSTKSLYEALAFRRSFLRLSLYTCLVQIQMQ